MGTFKVDGAIIANGKLTSNTTGARLTTDNGTTSIWFGINIDGSAWGIYNIGTSKYILRQTAAGTNFYGNSDSATKLATARNFTIGSASAKAFDGTAALTWTHAEIGATVSNSWTAGTTAGPKIVTTVNGVAGTGVAIPAASTTASGVVTTGNQRFRGVKTLEYPTISSNSTQYQGFYYKNSADTVVGEHWLDCGNKTNITKTQYYWRQHSPNSTANTSTTGYHETYSLPACATGLTANKSYEIFTSKSYSTLDGRYLKLSGGTMTGSISYQTTNYASTPLYVLDDGTNYGHTLIIGAGGTTYVGAGESAGALQSANGTSSAENLYLCADSNIYLMPGCNTIANRKTSIVLESSGAISLNYNTYLAAGKHLYMGYSGSDYPVIHNHNNGNISINAAGRGLYLGYLNTDHIYCRGSYVNIDSGNYTSYTVTKTGSGASGSWGIDVTGYSKTIAYPDQLTTDAAIDGFNTANRFQAATWNSTSTPGVSNGMILSAGWTSTSYGAQIAIDDDPTYYIALRQRDGNGWKAWKRIPMGDGTGASGTWGINVTGSSASCTGNAYSTSVDSTCIAYCGWSNELNFGGTNNSSTIYFGYRAVDSKPIPTQFIFGGSSGTATIKAGAVYGAVWNDYAEYRQQKEQIKPGYCVASNNQGQVYKTTEKYQACDGIVSDTFGFAIGETNECKTPLAVAGRVLAYVNGNRADYQAGDTVCAGPNGRICKMSREEIREYPDRIVGIVSEIPDYEVWGSGNIAVNGRIWIKIK